MYDIRWQLTVVHVPSWSLRVDTANYIHFSICIHIVMPTYCVDDDEKKMNRKQKTNNAPILEFINNKMTKK